MTPDEPADTSGARNGQPGPASVADEAMRLAEAFATWAQNTHRATDARASYDATAADRDPGDAAGQASSAASASADHHTAAPGCDCAHAPAVEAVCRMCPVCRLAGLVQAVQPDLLDRVADLLGMVAGGLRTAAREGRATDTTGPAAGDHDEGMDVPVTGGEDD